MVASNDGDARRNITAVLLIAIAAECKNTTYCCSQKKDEWQLG